MHSIHFVCASVLPGTGFFRRLELRRIFFACRIGRHLCRPGQKVTGTRAVPPAGVTSGRASLPQAAAPPIHSKLAMRSCFIWFWDLHAPSSFLLHDACLRAAFLVDCLWRTALANPPTGVPLVRVMMAPAIPAGRTFTGTAAAREQSYLGLRIPGKEIARRVDTGHAVKRGQVLARPFR